MDFSHAKLQLWDISFPLLTSKDFIPMCCNMSLATTMNLPPLSESVVVVKVCSPIAAHFASDFVGFLDQNVADSSGLVAAHTVATVHNGLKSLDFESYWIIGTKYAPGSVFLVAD